MQKVQEFLPGDSDRVSSLTPEDWNDIQSAFSWYCQIPWIQARKIESGSSIAAVGAAIHYRNSSWLAHIITHPDYRRQGFGSRMLQELIQVCRNRNSQGIHLFATDEGAPLYARHGFRKVAEYCFFRKDTDCIPGPLEAEAPLENSRETDYPEILELDRTASGEDRSELLQEHLRHAIIYRTSQGKTGEITGFFLPTLGEGPITAFSNEAAKALIKLKSQTQSRATLPAQNSSGIQMLLNAGWTEVIRASRMCYGTAADFRQETCFSRIGGNLG
ncbi:GNAT family N-acetyltransferase [Spirochaeta dissipatitropha]